MFLKVFFLSVLLFFGGVMIVNGDCIVNMVYKTFTNGSPYDSLFLFYFYFIKLNLHLIKILYYLYLKFAKRHDFKRYYFNNYYYHWDNSEGGSSMLK